MEKKYNIIIIVNNVLKIIIIVIDHIDGVGYTSRPWSKQLNIDISNFRLLESNELAI